MTKNKGLQFTSLAHTINLRKIRNEVGQIAQKISKKESNHLQLAIPLC